MYVITSLKERPIRIESFCSVKVKQAATTCALHMPQKRRFCILCNRHDRVQRSRYTCIYTPEREAKLLEGYRRRHLGQELPQPILNQMVHKKCYNRTVQGISEVPVSTPVERNDSSAAEDDGHESEQVKEHDIPLQRESYYWPDSVWFRLRSFSAVRVCPFHRPWTRSYLNVRNVSVSSVINMPIADKTVWDRSYRISLPISWRKATLISSKSPSESVCSMLTFMMRAFEDSILVTDTTHRWNSNLLIIHNMFIELYTRHMIHEVVLLCISLSSRWHHYSTQLKKNREVCRLKSCCQHPSRHRSLRTVPVWSSVLVHAFSDPVCHELVHSSSNHMHG